MNYLTPAPVVQMPPAQIPPKIQAALAFTHFCEHVTNQHVQTMSGGTEKAGRRLSAGEQRCYDAALTSMTEYFNTDGFGDTPPPPTPPPSGGGNAPVPAPVKAH